MDRRPRESASPDRRLHLYPAVLFAEKDVAHLVLIEVGQIFYANVHVGVDYPVDLHLGGFRLAQGFLKPAYSRAAVLSALSFFSRSSLAFSFGSKPTASSVDTPDSEPMTLALMRFLAALVPPQICPFPEVMMIC